MTTREIFPHPLSVHSYLLRVRGGLDLYMESGILDHLNVGFLNEDTHKPSQLHYNDAINAIRGDGAALGELKVKEISNNKLEGENMDEGESSAIGCSDKLGSISVADAFGNSDTLFSSPPAFCGDLRERKFIQTQMPASMWSGKLRLMIQSIYGSKREDYEMDEILGNFSPLTLDGESIQHSGLNGAVGLFSGRDFEYFMIRTQSSGISAKALKPQGAGRKLRDYLLENPSIPAARKQRYEAYLLSTLKFEGSWVDIGEIGDIFSHGGTFGYGFAWNWAGDTAYAAVHELKEDSTNVWEASLVKIAISEGAQDTLDDGRLSATATVEEGPTDFTFAVSRDLIWTPDFLLGGMNLFVTQANAFDAPVQMDSDVPIHAMTNYENDTFDLVRFKREDKGSGDGAFGENTVSGFIDVEAEVRCVSSACDMFSTAIGSVVERGFYITRINGDKYAFFESVSETGNGVNAGAVEAFRGNILNARSVQDAFVGGDQGQQCDPKPDGALSADQMNTEASGGSLDVDGNFSGKYLLLIPFYDCDAVYMGSLWRFDGVITTRKTTDGSFAANATYWYDSNNASTRQFISATREFFAWAGQSHGSKNLKVANDPDFIKKAIQVDTVFSVLRLEYFFNGAFVGVHEDNKVEDGDVADAMYMPGCFGAFPFDEPPEWETGSQDFGGYDTHFGPIPIFPSPVQAPAVFSRTSGIDHSYKITKDPGDTWLDDGSYDYEEIDNTLFSYVGFA